MKRLIAVFVAAFIGASALQTSVAARGCSGNASGVGNVFIGSAECTSDASGGAHGATNAGDIDDYSAYRWKLACLVSVGAAFTCTFNCPPGEVPYQLFGLHDGEWYPLATECRAIGQASLAPTVTPALVAHAFRRIPLPALRAVTQPADKTLINFDTIFYVQAAPLHRTLTLLGQRVELAITPTTFRWVHGDGTTAVTHTAGAAYPAKDVVYRYQQAHVTVRQHVEIVWTARWRLNGGPYQEVDGMVTTVGPETPLRIAEATPALSGYGH